MKTHRGSAALLLLLVTAIASPSTAAMSNWRWTTVRGGTWRIPPVSIPSDFKILYRAFEEPLVMSMAKAGSQVTWEPSLLSKVGLGWNDSSTEDVSTDVERSTSGGAWVAVRTYDTPLDG